MHININSTNIAVNSVTNKVYVLNPLNTITQPFVVSIIDGASNKLKYTIPLPWNEGDYSSCASIPYMHSDTRKMIFPNVFELAYMIRLEVFIKTFALHMKVPTILLLLQTPILTY